MTLLLKNLRTWAFASAALFLLVLAACGPPARLPEPNNIFWPLPPERPRIKYVQSIYSEDDIGRVYTFSEKLFGKDYFDAVARPYGVSAKRGRVYVSDLVLRRVLVFDYAARRMIIVGQEGCFQNAAAAVSDAAGNIYVADSVGAKICVYGAQGNYLTSLAVDGAKPVGLAVSDALGRLYIVDRAMHRVVVLGLDGKRLFEFGGRGNVNGRFNIPLDISIDAQGTVYVLDNGNFRVQLFTPDGAYLSKFGTVGDRPGTFANPKGIAVDSEGHIYVTDAAFSNIQIFDREGNILLSVGELGAWAGHMQLPAGIAIDENDRIYVADQLNARVQVFQYLKEPVPGKGP
jgi:DNA-binding beta-propeller fold protein YncE